MTLLYILEQGFSSAQDDGLSYDPKFIDQAGIDQAGHQRRAPDGMHVLAGLLFQRTKSSTSRTIRVFFQPTSFSVFDTTI
jgi:hypothetical protein